MLVELPGLNTIKPYANNPLRNDAAVAAVGAGCLLLRCHHATLGEVPWIEGRTPQR